MLKYINPEKILDKKKKQPNNPLSLQLLSGYIITFTLKTRCNLSLNIVDNACLIYLAVYITCPAH